MTIVRFAIPLGIVALGVLWRLNRQWRRTIGREPADRYGGTGDLEELVGNAGGCLLLLVAALVVVVVVAVIGSLP